jgi:hypothetical protein
MNFKTLTGWVLAITPVLAFVFWGILFQAVISPGETATTEVLAMMKNENASAIFIVFGSLGFAGIFIGLTMWSRMIQEQGGSALSGLAAMLFIVCATLAFASNSLTIASLEVAKEGLVEAAVMVNLVGDSIAGLLPIPWSIGFVLLGLSHAKQAANTLGNVIGYVLVALGVLFFIGFWLPDNEVLDNIGFVIWIVMTLTIITAGVVKITSKN